MGDGEALLTAPPPIGLLLPACLRRLAAAMCPMPEPTGTAVELAKIK